MYLYGGSSQSSENDQLYTLFMNSMEWRVVKTLGESPGYLDEHSAVVSGKEIVIFGGFGRNGRSNDVFTFNIEDKLWTWKRGGDDPRRYPQPRSGHDSVVLGDSMWMFGGQGDTEKFNDLWRYSIHFNTWDQVQVDDESSPLQWSGHSMTTYKHYLIIFGGIHEVTKELDDAYAFNTKTNKFTMLSGLDNGKH